MSLSDWKDFMTSQKKTALTFVHLIETRIIGVGTGGPAGPSN